MAFDPKELAAVPERDRPSFMFTRIFGMLAGMMVDDLEPIIESYKPALLVRESAEFGGPIAAALAGVPSVTHAIGGLMPTEQLEAMSEQIEKLWQERGLTAPPYGGSYEYLYLDIYPHSIQRTDLDHVPYRQPLRPVSYATDGDDTLPSWPDQYSAYPLVYITFGTAPGGAAIGTILEALRDLPVRIVVTVGQRGDPAKYGEQPPNVHIAHYIPQTQLLGSCAVVVSHTGSGTFLGALSQGVPQLCVPGGADQFQNAEACARAGAGIELDPDEVTTEAVRAAAERLLEDEGFRSAAVGLSEEIARMPSPDDVASILAERFGSENGS